MKVQELLAELPIERFRNPPPVVAVVRLSGVIGQIGPLRGGLSLAGLASTLERAFKLYNVKSVALAINSPGGSPVQSALIARRIRALAQEHEVPVLAFAEDVAASGGYWLACAADEIFADENSIVGSIGVVSGGFGLSGLIRRLGVERRLYTAGERKAMLDPFLPEKPEDVERLRAVQRDIHDSFKSWVGLRRGAKLKGSVEDLYSGEFWTGKRALELGLIDGIGDLRGVLRERHGDNVKLRVIGPPRPWFRLPFLRSAIEETDRAAAWTGQVMAAVEERTLWSRYGL
ncbi:MAG: S49 family peptidase [Rhodospirillaceae bacterium]|nr:S49 family peptidase [Rhodospirillaceae bacterium]